MFKLKAETIQMFKEDLPDDIEAIVDDVAKNTSAIVDELMDEYETVLKNKADTYKTELNTLLQNFDAEINNKIKEAELNTDAVIEKLAALKTSNENLLKSVEAQPSLDLDMTSFNEKSNELSSVINTQRQSIRNISSTIGSYVGSITRKVIPF